MVLRLGPSQRFEVPVIEVLVSQRRLQLWILVSNVGLLIMTLIDAIFFGNFLALEFGAGETYGSSFAFWLLFFHIVKLPHLVFTMFAIGRSQTSFSTGRLQLALIFSVVVALADLVTLIVLLIEITKCTDAYCFRQAGDGIGMPGMVTMQFFILLFTVIGSLVIRIAAAVAISFVKQRIRVRNTAALENIATNRNPRDPLRGIAGVNTVTAVAGALPADSAAATTTTEREGDGQWELRFLENETSETVPLINNAHLQVQGVQVFRSKSKSGADEISGVVMPVVRFLASDSETSQDETKYE